MFDRDQLHEAIDLIAAQRARFGDAATATALEVLEDFLTSLPGGRGRRAAEVSLPEEQRKQVTILFATLDGFTRLDSATHQTDRLRQIDLLWRRIDETILYHGGIVDKHMGDVTMGIFGAPLSRENDPERAVQCGLALRDVVNEYLIPLDQRPEGDSPAPDRRPMIRIGINTGRVSLGQVGSDTGLTVIGDSVNVASRLKEAAAESGIYISQDTYRLVSDLFRVEPLGEITVKGRQTPVTVYRVVGSRPRLFFPGAEGVGGVHVPMVGREEEMSVLQEALRRSAQEGRGGLITIVGEAGVGKSRLAREFHRRLGELPVKATILQARTDQRLALVPYSLLRDLLIRHFGIAESDRMETIEDKIVESLKAALPAGRRLTGGREFRTRARAIGRLAGLGVAGPLQAAESPEVAAGRERAIAAILEYFTAAARRSAVTLFFLEDIHWADEDSLALLERIAAVTADAPILMICLARPLLYERRPEWPGDTATVIAAKLSLEPLSETHCRELVLSILRKLPQTPQALSELIVQSAAGNPFYVEELIRVLIEDGVIVPDEAAWRLRQRELTRLRVPPTLTGVLQARLDRLPDVERIVLQQAAVIGDEFWASAVQQTNRAARFAYSEEQIEAALDSLVRRDMVFRSPRPTFKGGQAYLFKHAVLREVTYESVLLRDRAGYHLQAARWLEAQSGDRVAEYAAPVAQHHEQAGRPADAARFYELAAARATEQYKYGGAIDYYRKVLDLLKSLPQYLDTRLAVMERLGDALRRQARLVEALDAYRAMQDSAELDGNILGRARAENAQASVLLELGEDFRALTAALEAEQLARLTGADMELLRAKLRQAEAMGRLNDVTGAIRTASQALERSRSMDAPRETARALALLGGFYRESDEAESANRVEQEMLSLADELKERGDTDDAADVLARLGEAMVNAGRKQEAGEFLERALDWQRAAGEQGAIAETLLLLGLRACRMDEATEAIGRLEEAAELAESTGNRRLRLSCRLALGEALLSRGLYPAAEAMLRQVVATAEDRQRLGSWVKLPHAYQLLVEVLNRQGRRDEAVRVVRASPNKN